MKVEVDFEWKLDCGAEITVIASGSYSDGGIDFPILGFATLPTSECANEAIFLGISEEYSQIEEHAVIVLCEQARIQRREVS
jgi:hypothetical protein